MYTIYYESQVESYKVNEFDSFEKAKAYADEQVQNCTRVYDNDNTGRFERFHVYLGEPIEVIDDEDVLKDPIYSTNMVYLNY